MMKTIILKIIMLFFVIAIFALIFSSLKRGSIEISDIENKSSIKILSSESFVSHFQKKFNSVHVFGDIASELEEERFRLKMMDLEKLGIILREQAVSLIQIQNIQFFNEITEKFYEFEIRPWNMAYLAKNEEAPLIKFRMYIEKLTDNKTDTNIHVELLSEKTPDTTQFLKLFRNLEDNEISGFLALLRLTRNDLISFNQGMLISISILTQGLFEYDFKTITTTAKSLVFLLKIIVILLILVFVKPFADKWIKKYSKTLNRM